MMESHNCHSKRFEELYITKTRVKRIAIIFQNETTENFYGIARKRNKLVFMVFLLGLYQSCALV